MDPLSGSKRRSLSRSAEVELVLLGGRALEVHAARLAHRREHFLRRAAELVCPVVEQRVERLRQRRGAHGCLQTALTSASAASQSSTSWPGAKPRRLAR